VIEIEDLNKIMLF